MTGVNTSDPQLSSSPDRPPPAVATVAASLFAVSVMFFLGSFWYLVDMYRRAYSFNPGKETARRRAVFLSTVPIGLVACVLLIFLGGTRIPNGASSTNALFGAVTYGSIFIFLLPLSLW